MARIKILLIGESATVAHVARPFNLALELHARGYEVHFATGPYFTSLWNDAPFPVHNIHCRSPQDFQAILEAKGVLFDEAILTRYNEEDRILMQQIAPDVVIGDLRQSLAISAPLEKIPYIALTNAYWSPFVSSSGLPAPCSDAFLAVRDTPELSIALLNARKKFNEILPYVFTEQIAGLNAVRQRYGLANFPDYLTGYSWGDHTAYLDTPSLVATHNLPANHSYIGAVSWSPKVPIPLWVSELRGKRVVYLSLGSSGISRLYEPILAALSEFGLPIVVATSGYELQGTLPRECYHAPYLPAHAILPHAILAITNGGSPSSYQAISHGVPVLGVPFNMDQLLCMEHLEKSGSALTLRVDTFSTFNLKRLSKEIIESTSYHLAACSQAKELQRYDATTEIEKIIHNLITRFRKCTNGFNSS